jgi:hypothetical protein
MMTKSQVNRTNNAIDNASLEQLQDIIVRAQIKANEFYREKFEVKKK